MKWGDRDYSWKHRAAGQAERPAEKPGGSGRFQTATVLQLDGVHDRLRAATLAVIFSCTKCFITNPVCRYKNVFNINTA